MGVYQYFIGLARVFGLLLMLLLFTNKLQAQFAFQRNNDVVVEENGTMAFPWVGGLNNPQFSKADINLDGFEDLVVFNRSSFSISPDTNGHRVLTFLNNGIANVASYTYAPQFEQYFPQVEYFLAMPDMTCDGIPDIVTFSSSTNFFGMDVHEGYYDDTILKFRFKDYIRDSLSTFISVLSSDIPAFTDVNGDGDVDVLIFDNFTNAYVNYFENRSVEYGSCGDTLMFVLTEYCWGAFSENPSTNFIALNTSCPFKLGLEIDPTQTGSPRHAGGTIMAFDENADGFTDLLLGDVSYSYMTRILNSQTNTNAMMVGPVDASYPNYNQPIQVPLFPAGFYLDIDNDGQKDLMVAPNGPKQGLNHNCSWFYKDVDPSDSVQFEFQTDSFLITDMIDLGEGAYPAFFDYNGDGLMDLVVGNYGYYTDTSGYLGRLALFQNVGTATTPAYKLVDRDFIRLSALNQNSGWKNLIPAFGDMDLDGDIDLLLGDETGVLRAFINYDLGNGQAIFALLDSQFRQINVGNTSAPFIYDVNGDSLPDLLIGRKRGDIQYFENTGTPHIPMYSSIPTNSFFGGISVAESFLNGYSTVTISKLDTTDQLYVLVGNANGRIWGYEYNPDSIYSGSFNLVFTKFSGIDVGERSCFTIADITNDGKPEMIVGSYRGGLEFFTQSDSIADIVGIANRFENGLPNDIEVYPNPNNGSLFITLPNIRVKGAVEISIFSLTGQRIMNENVLSNDGKVLVNTEALSSGMYVMSVQVNGQTYTKRIVKF